MSNRVSVYSLLSDATATGAGTTVVLQSPGSISAAFQAWGSTTSGAGAATVTVEVSLDGIHWITHSTFNLTLSATAVTAGVVMSDEKWVFVRGNVTAVSGIGSSVSLKMGV